MNKDDMNETRTEYFIDATAEEYEAIKNIALKKQALKNMFEDIMDSYCNRMQICFEDEKNTWNKIKTRLKEQWPAGEDVRMDNDGKLYRNPGSRSE